jgi:hypothetical protein
MLRMQARDFPPEMIAPANRPAAIEKAKAIQGQASVALTTHRKLPVSSTVTPVGVDRRFGVGGGASVMAVSPTPSM